VYDVELLRDYLRGLRMRIDHEEAVLAHRLNVAHFLMGQEKFRRFEHEQRELLRERLAVIRRTLEYGVELLAEESEVAKRRFKNLSADKLPGPPWSKEASVIYCAFEAAGSILSLVDCEIVARAVTAQANRVPPP
jgi:hypothetical protein